MKTGSAFRGWLWVPLVSLQVSARAQTEPTPTFELTLERCPGTFGFAVDAPFTKEIGIYLTTSDNPSGIGAGSWALSVGVEGVEPLSITTDGTLAALETADPPGLRKTNSFHRTELARCPESNSLEPDGAMTAVVLSLNDPVTLPPTGPALVARLTVGGIAPDQAGERLEGRVRFRDGCRGSGKPITNVIDWQGGGVKPGFGVSCDIAVVAAPSFIRGDPNEDGELDISDSLFILGCKFLGTGCPGCRDAGDMNDDGAMDISDAVHGLNFLFSGRPPPPHPGPAACGADPTIDLLPDCVYSRC